MTYIVKVDNDEFKIDLKKEGKDFKVLLNGKERNVEVAHEEGTQFTLIVDNKPYNIVLESDGNTRVNDEIYSVKVVDEQIQKSIKASPDKFHKKELVIKSPMPGLIIEINVKERESVKKGQGLLVVEAMKMQNEMTSSKDGVVRKIFCKKGQTVNSGDTLITIE